MGNGLGRPPRREDPGRRRPRRFQASKRKTPTSFCGKSLKRKFWAVAGCRGGRTAGPRPAGGWCGAGVTGGLEVGIGPEARPRPPIGLGEAQGPPPLYIANFFL